MNSAPHQFDVAVVIITYQHSAFIERCLDSVRMQTISEQCQVIIRDDASTDGTQDRIYQFLERHGLNWQLVALEDNKFSEVEPLGDAFKYCRCDFVAVLEGDDFWESAEKLERQIALLNAWPQLSGVGHLVRNHDPKRTTPGMNDTIQGVPGWNDRGQVFDCHLGSMVVRKEVVRAYQRIIGPGMAGDLVLAVCAINLGPTFVFPFVWGNRWKLPTGLTASCDVLALQQSSCRALMDGNLGLSGNLLERVRGHWIKLTWAQGLATRKFLSGWRVLFSSTRTIKYRRRSTLTRLLLYPITRKNERLQPTLHGKSVVHQRQAFRSSIGQRDQQPREDSNQART